jgi:hypothetical protein
MGEPNIAVLGVYRVPADDDLFDRAMEVKYGSIDLSAGEKDEAERAVREELSGIILIEARVTDADDRFDAADFSQGDQVAYDEAYLSEDGESVVSKDDRPPGGSFRIAFFLHYFDHKMPIGSSYGDIVLPPPSEMPERLKGLMPYEPVD